MEPLSSQGSQNGVHKVAIDMGLFPSGCLWMESTEKMGYPEWNQDLNQELMQLMDWTSAIDVVKIHCIMMTIIKKKLYNAIFMILH